MEQFFIKVIYYNPCSHENDWCIISEDNGETLGEETAMMFDSELEAWEWTQSKQAMQWLPCKFEVHKSVYKKEV